MVCQAATAWMARATHRVMRTGDVVFIPANTYHLLRSDGFGVSLGFDVFPPDPDASPDRRRRLRSNGYLTAPPALPCVGDRDAPGFAAVAGSALEWCAEDDSQIAVFMRGRRVLFSDTPWLDEALRLLGSPRTFNQDDLTAVTARPEASQQILSLALDLGAIRSIQVHHG